jgi:hypothetical protein
MRLNVFFSLHTISPFLFLLSMSRCAVIAIAWTPASVRPAKVTETFFPLRNFFTASYTRCSKETNVELDVVHVAYVEDEWM